MSKPLSAVDCVSPSFERTKRQLFVSFRFRRWVRLAIVCLVLGDFAGGGGYTGSFNLPGLPDRRNSPQSTIGFLDWSQLQPFIPWLIGGAVLLLAFIVLWLYMASVYRFILFESVLYDRCELKGAWGRWEAAGRSYFLWLVSLSFAVMAVSLLLGGGAAFVGWRLEIFQHPGDHLALLILGGLTILCILFGFLMATALAGVFAKDFCVPLMAIENLPVLDAWRRLLPMLAAEKMAYAGFVLMKIVLAVGSAIIFGIITVLTLIAVAIPLAIGGAALFFGGKAAGLSWDFPLIGVVAILGGVVISGILYLLALISTPPMVFFQAYVIYFFGSRYPALGVIAFPPSPTPQPSATDVGPPVAGPPLEPEPIG
jgi:hypothetical protein